jgi:polyferredoxin
MTGDLHLPVPALILAGPIFRGEGFFMLLLFLGTVLLVGPAWCSHLCYIGAWDQRAAAGRKSPRRLPAWTAGLRLVIFLLVPAVAWGLRLSGVHWIWAVSLAAGFGLVGLGVMATASRATGVMVHCTVFCPLGLAAVALGKLLPWRLRIAPDCDACGRCSRACRYQALEPEHLQQQRPGLSCTLCGDCIGHCRTGRIAYAFPLLAAPAARRLFVLLVASLHALFLATARM